MIMYTTYKHIYLVFALLILASSCEKEDPSLEFGEPKTYFKIGNSEELTAPEVVYFINGSQNVDEYFWEFQGGKLIEDGNTLDQESFEGIQPDGVRYDQPGTYTTTLTTTNNGAQTSKQITFDILKQQPSISFDVVAIKFLEPVTFIPTHYTYPGKENEVTYNWDFGDGNTSTQKSPTIIYEIPGEYTVTLTINDTQETLTATKQIEVKGELAPTLYFTDAITNRLMSRKLFTVATSEMEQTDLSLGLHPLSVSVSGDQLVVTEAGDNIKFSAWGTAADGRVIKSNLAGQNVEIITTTDEGGNAYVRDPFSATVDEEGNVYWVNRFEGIRKLPIASVEADYPEVFIPLLAADIGESSTYGWTDGDVVFVDGQIWYSKHGTGKGLYKFSLDGTYIEKVEGLASVKIRAFAVDLEFEKIYFAVNIESGGLAPGLYTSDINGNDIKLVDDLAGFSPEGGDAERTYITDMVIDAQNGYLYYPYRSELDIDASGLVVGDGSNSGIKRFKLDLTGSPEIYQSGVITYGIDIDRVNR